MKDEDDRIEALEERIAILEHALQSIHVKAKVAQTWASYTLDQVRKLQDNREDSWL